MVYNRLSKAGLVKPAIELENCIYIVHYNPRFFISARISSM